ncbi:MAG: heme anaerobic degradation radical SAM methyltransferase ChuW/HutW [Anaerovibrio sp.]|uniref:heme anaerobic degradation radical SAM methyltransferase ChuW/HutW n=1 Tax=Anaerovibrio sp. TaxID=1872532 RepID=UPI0025ED7B95|nr:heme anaerobic degradation radical SAM methyltransferase ChuW/HutW [Anaerovibrio sp.]MCR5176413.1 heme anaerobic degradation radical SAM methyltransferase ChuW/HutW [Anaerovibrio sp.]
MNLEKYLNGLSPEKRDVLLGNDTSDALHGAFTNKRVVHAGLMGDSIAGEKQQESYELALKKAADQMRQHVVYIHIPFCQTKCLYCGFYQNASKQEVEDKYVEALIAEIKAETSSRQIKDTVIDCVFLGGGTPTSLSPENAGKLLGTIKESFTLSAGCEFTLEGRIHDLVPEKIDVWLANGVNRISLGVQSFNTKLRQRIGRIDTREEVLKRLALLKSYDVTVIVDLIFGLPGQTREMWLEDVKTLAEADVDGMDLYQLNIFPGGALAKAVENGTVPPCADIAGQADMYVASRDYLLDQGVERLSLCHWRRSKRERSLYNTMAKAGADVYAFGCGAGGHFGGVVWMNHRSLADYNAVQEKGLKPIMMAGHSAATKLGMIGDKIISDLEKGFVDYRGLMVMDHRMTELERVLSLWCSRGLMQADLGVYRLTKAGEFWYVSLSQSLVECAQVLWDEDEADMPVEEINGKTNDALDEVLAEMMPESTAESRENILKKMPVAVRMMLRKSSKDTLKTMLASMPAAMRDKMLSSLE